MNVGLIGLGTVGSGVVKTLANFDDIKITKIVVKNINKKRDIPNLDMQILTDNAQELINDPQIDVIIEVAGGVETIFDILKQAIQNKKHIVTANKELLAKHGSELFKLAKENGVAILYEASVGGGIPIIMPMKTALKANKITKIAAILNGTTNYILTKMAEDGCDYDIVLREAQSLGYAETDPTGDVEGFDAAYKISILASIAFKKRIDITKIYKEGITKITAHDIQNAENLGYKIKLVAQAKQLPNNAVDIRVHPVLIPVNAALAQINNVTNAITLEGFPVGVITFTGPGAGEYPTASAVVSDLLALKAELANGKAPLLSDNTHADEDTPQAEQIDILQTENKYYISLNVANEPGAIGLIGTICGRCNISLSSIVQKGISANKTAEVIVITEMTQESNVQRALETLRKESAINNINNIIRVMD